MAHCGPRQRRSSFLGHFHSHPLPPLPQLPKFFGLPPAACRLTPGNPATTWFGGGLARLLSYQSFWRACVYATNGTFAEAHFIFYCHFSPFCFIIFICIVYILYMCVRVCLFILKKNKTLIGLVLFSVNKPFEIGQRCVYSIYQNFGFGFLEKSYS